MTVLYWTLYYIMQFWQCIQIQCTTVESWCEEPRLWKEEVRPGHARRTRALVRLKRGAELSEHVYTVQLAHTLSCLEGLGKQHQVPHTLSEKIKNMCRLWCTKLWHLNVCPLDPRSQILSRQIKSKCAIHILNKEKQFVNGNLKYINVSS